MPPSAARDTGTPLRVLAMTGLGGSVPAGRTAPAADASRSVPATDAAGVRRPSAASAAAWPDGLLSGLGSSLGGGGGGSSGSGGGFGLPGSGGSSPPSPTIRQTLRPAPDGFASPQLR